MRSGRPGLFLGQATTQAMDGPPGSDGIAGGTYNRAPFQERTKPISPEATQAVTLSKEIGHSSSQPVPPLLPDSTRSLQQPIHPCGSRYPSSVSKPLITDPFRPINPSPTSSGPHSYEAIEGGHSHDNLVALPNDLFLQYDPSYTPPGPSTALANASALPNPPAARTALFSAKPARPISETSGGPRRKLRLSEKLRSLRSLGKRLRQSSLDHGGPNQSPLPEREGTIYGRFIERGLPTGETQAERVEHIKRQLFERSIELELPFENGQRMTIRVRAWIDWFCPCNIFNPRILERLPRLNYESTGQRSYANTLGGPAYSKARFVGRWLWPDADVFDPTYDDVEFEIPDRCDLRCDVIIGRPAIERHDLFKIVPRMPLAAPMGLRTELPSINRHSIRFRDEMAMQRRQHEAGQTEQASTYQQLRDYHAHEQAHMFVSTAYRHIYQAKYREAAEEFDRSNGRR